MVDLVGIGSVLTGLGGVFGSRRKNPSPYDQAKQQLEGAFKAADDAGIHRLAVAGSPAGYSPAPSSAADGIMTAGQAIADYGRHRQSKKLQAKQADLLDAQIAETRSRTILNEANARRSFGAPQPGLGGATRSIPGAFDATYRAAQERPVSIEPERDMPATQTVTAGPLGARGPNPEAFEVGISELIAGGLIYGPQWLMSAIDRYLPRQERGKEPKSREKARSQARERNQRAQRSPYLFGR